MALDRSGRSSDSVRFTQLRAGWRSVARTPLLQNVDPPLHPLDCVPGHVEVVEALAVLVGLALKVGIPGASALGASCGQNLRCSPPGNTHYAYDSIIHSSDSRHGGRRGIIQDMHCDSFKSGLNNVCPHICPVFGGNSVVW